jgi:hypothetical protein
VTEEARLQYEKTAEERCEGCKMAKHAGPCASEKKAADMLALDHVEKLAGALDFIADTLLKTAAEGHHLAGSHNLQEHLQTNAPGVSQATASKSLPDHKGQGMHPVPMHPAMQKDLPAEHGATQMENNQDHAPQMHQHQIQTNYGKHASAVGLIREKLASTKASDEHEKKETEGLAEAKKGLETAEKAHKSEPENKHATVIDYMRAKIKQAEDALNPAQIKAGPAVPPGTSAAGQPGGAPAGGHPKGPTGLVASTDAARHYTKGEAYANRKEDLGKYFVEPALRAEHDKTLQVAFEHTGKAGPKIASAASFGKSVAEHAGHAVGGFAEPFVLPGLRVGRAVGHGLAEGGTPEHTKLLAQGLGGLGALTATSALGRHKGRQQQRERDLASSKAASADSPAVSVKTAAARALLSKLAEDIDKRTAGQAGA